MDKISEDILREAHDRIVPKGYKPEDYLMVGYDLPIRIARMIVDEARHIIKMKKANEKFNFYSKTF